MTVSSPKRSSRDQRRRPSGSPSPQLRSISPVQDGAASGVTVQPLGAEHREKLCSAIGLGVKVSLALVAGVSLIRLSSAYQERMERHAELRAVLDIQSSKLEKARDRFDHLFAIGGEQALIRQQGQWIAPNRLRVVWTR